ncbi:ribonuclease H-like domain-containing protein, partial [Tanacetum coccineum]
MVRTLNNIIRTLIFQAKLPPTYWIEALHMVVHILNIIPSTAINDEVPFTRLFGTSPDYSLLRTFGCLCYPHVYPNHKLEPRATPSLFLGNAYNHRGYRCLDLTTNKIIISRHVTFDETVFPYGSTPSTTVLSYTFLYEPDINLPSVSVSQIPPLKNSPHTPPTSPPHAAQPATPTMAQSPIPPSNDRSAHPHSPITTPMAQDHSNEHAPNIIPDPPVNPNPDSVHHMVICFRVGSNRPIERLTLHVSSVSPLPRSYHEAFNDVNWQNAMQDKYNALIKIVLGLLHLDLQKSVLFGGVDVDKTFSPVVKTGTIRTVLSLAASRNWSVHQLDVKNAFLHRDLSETLYMHQPPGFRDSAHPDYVCLLQRPLYGLKQASCASCKGFFKDVLSQKKYVVEILERAGMVNFNPNRTPVDTESKLGTTCDVVSDPTMYRSLAGSLQYLTFTRPDISYVVQQLFSSSTTDLVAYSDADWAGCPTTRRSTSEAEYHGVANVVAETCWLRNLLCELHTSLSSATLVYCDN